MKLEGKSLKRDFLRFVLPSITAQWVFTLYTIVDGIFVARGVSETALTAVNISMPYMMALFAFSILFAVGTSTIVAIFLGEGRREKACEAFTQNIVLLTGVSVAVTLLMLWQLDALVTFLGATEANRQYVTAYLRTLVPFSGAFILSYSFEMLIKTDGFPKMATVIVTVGAGMNVILDYFMVMRWEMGVEGAALATGISNTAIIVLYLLHFLGKKGMIRFRSFSPEFSQVGRAFRNGLSSGITELSAGFIIFLFNQAIIHYLDTDALVSYTIISYVNSLAVVTMIGIAQGYQPLVSYYHGQKRRNRCAKLRTYGILSVLAISCFYTGGCLLFARQIVGLFVSEALAALTVNSIRVFRIFSLSFLLLGYNIVISGYFIAIEWSGFATAISLARSVVVLTASLCMMILMFGGVGIWWTPLVSEGLTLILTAALIRKYLQAEAA